MTTHEAMLPLFSPMAKAPAKKYRTLVADPPWPYDLRAKDESHRARVTYPTMSISELMNLPVGLWAEDASHLYLWTTNAFMVEAHQIAKAWGFEPKTILTWVKGRLDGGRIVHHIGMGNYYRNSTEHVLFCVRGSLATNNHDLPTAFLAERREHSEKPAAFYDLVAHMSPGPFLDVFARKQRMMAGASFEVMDTFGNEAFVPDGLLATLSSEQRQALGR